MYGDQSGEFACGSASIKDRLPAPVRENEPVLIPRKGSWIKDGHRAYTHTCVDVHMKIFQTDL